MRKLEVTITDIPFKLRIKSRRDDSGKRHLGISLTAKYEKYPRFYYWNNSRKSYYHMELGNTGNKTRASEKESLLTEARVEIMKYLTKVK